MPQPLSNPSRSPLPAQDLHIPAVVFSCRWYRWFHRYGAAFLLLSGMGTLALALPARCEIEGGRRSRPTISSAPFSSAPPTATWISSQRPAAPASSRSAPPPAAPSVAWLIVMPSVPIVGGAWIYFTRRLFGTGDVMKTESRSLDARPEPSPCEPPLAQDDNADTDV